MFVQESIVVYMRLLPEFNHWTRTLNKTISNE